MLSRFGRRARFQARAAVFAVGKATPPSGAETACPCVQGFRRLPKIKVNQNQSSLFKVNQDQKIFWKQATDTGKPAIFAQQ